MRNRFIRRLVSFVPVAVMAAAALTAAAATNELERRVAHHAPCLALLGRNVIRVESGGTIPVRFTDALSVLTQTNLLDRVQEEYARSLPPGRTPEFVLRPTGSNVWSYVNRHGQYSEVHEVERTVAADGVVNAVFYAKGERFFGLFESLNAIEARAAEDGAIRYTVRVLAYPHQPVCRFVARHLGLVERFFRSKTRELEAVTARVCRRLCENEAPAAARSGIPDSHVTEIGS